jgi:hypothetical protein
VESLGNSQMSGVSETEDGLSGSLGNVTSLCGGVSAQQRRPRWVFEQRNSLCGGVSATGDGRGGSFGNVTRRGGVSSTGRRRVGLWVTELSVVKSLKQETVTRWVFGHHTLNLR